MMFDLSSVALLVVVAIHSCTLIVLTFVVSSVLFWSKNIAKTISSMTIQRARLLLVSLLLSWLVFLTVFTASIFNDFRCTVANFDASYPQPQQYNISSVNLAAFVRRDGMKLMIGNERFLPLGTNDYTLPFFSAADTKIAMDNFQKLGVNVVRTWLHNEEINPIPGYVYMHRFNGVTNFVDDNGLKPVDVLIAEASKRNIKLILTLNDNWNYYGGIPAYNSWYKLKYHDQFFTEPVTRAAYKRWELINEPRCQGNANQPTRSECAGPLRTRPNMPKPYFIKNWVIEMSSYIKAIDPVHLVSVGDDGFVALDGPSTGWDAARWGYYGVDWTDLLAIPTIDVGTTHFYPDTNSLNHTHDGIVWVNWHGEIARQMKKPVILEEYFSVRSDQKFRLLKAWLDAVVANGGSRGFQGDLVWMVRGTATKTNISSYTVSPSDPYFKPMFKKHVSMMKKVS